MWHKDADLRACQVSADHRGAFIYGEASQLVSTERLEYTWQPLLYCEANRTHALMRAEFVYQITLVYCLQ